jgi:hypothetical protein
MKTKVIITALIIAILPVSMAVAACGGDDKAYDPIRNAYYGCGCKGGGTEGDVGNGSWVFCESGKMRRCKTGTWDDEFKVCEVKMCPGWYSGRIGNPSGFNAAIHEFTAEITDMCWKFKCRSGYFPFENGVLDKSKCVQCNAVNQTVQDGVCYTVDCPGITNGTHVVMDVGGVPKCVPVCDVTAARETYDESDPTKLTIKILQKNAGALGERPASADTCPTNSAFDPGACSDANFARDSKNIKCVKFVDGHIPETGARGCTCLNGYYTKYPFTECLP